MVFPYNALGLSHQFMKEHIPLGGVCIDGTAGKGRDTLFLAQLVGESGRILAFDIQSEAVEATKSLLSEHKIENTEVFLACHSTMADYAEENTVDAIMFNFGWLPGGDHNRFSHGKTSCLAIEKGLGLLKTGGVMSLCLYCGKETGFEEKESVLDYVKSLDQSRYSVLLADFINRKNNPPVVVFITKEK